MKRHILLYCTLLFACATPAFAAPASYIIIGDTTATGTKVTLSNITVKENYSCSFTDYSCVLASTTSVPIVSSSSAIVTAEDASAILDTIAPHAIPKQSLDTFTLPTTTTPKGATYVTKGANGWTAYYKNYGFYGRKFIRAYYAQNTNTGELLSFGEAIPHEWDLVTDGTHLFSWTKESDKLVYLNDRAGYMQLYLVDFNTHPNSLAGVLLTKGNYNVIDFKIIGNNVFFIANKNGSHVFNLYKQTLNTSKANSPVVVAKNVMYTNDLAGDDNTLLFTKEDNGRGVLYAYDIASQTVKLFSGITYPKLITGKSIEVNNPVRGIYMPAKKVSETAIIWLHGGPYRMSGMNRHSYGSYAIFDWMLEEARAAGTAVFKADYPGSFGFGSEYGNGLSESIGYNDVHNIERTIDYLRKKGHKRFVIMGTSYGGYLAAKYAATLPKYIDHAIAIAPVTDWRKLINDVSPTFFELHFKGIPQEANNFLYERASVLNDLSKSSAPITLIQGDKDDMVPYSQSLYLIAESAKRNKGASIDMIRLNNEKHVLKGPAQIQTVCAVLKFSLKNGAMSCDIMK